MFRPPRGCWASPAITCVIDWRAVPAYLGMSYLYKRSNWLWPILIRHRLTHAAWRPLVEFTRRRHVRFRAKLERLTAACDAAHDNPPPRRALSLLSAGV